MYWINGHLVLDKRDMNHQAVKDNPQLSQALTKGFSFCVNCLLPGEHLQWSKCTTNRKLAEKALESSISAKSPAKNAAARYSIQKPRSVLTVPLEAVQSGVKTIFQRHANIAATTRNGVMKSRALLQPLSPIDEWETMVRCRASSRRCNVCDSKPSFVGVFSVKGMRKYRAVCPECHYETVAFPTIGKAMNAWNRHYDPAYTTHGKMLWTQYIIRLVRKGKEFRRVEVGPEQKQHQLHKNVCHLLHSLGAVNFDEDALRRLVCRDTHGVLDPIKRSSQEYPLKSSFLGDDVEIRVRKIKFRALRSKNSKYRENAFDADY